MRPHARKAVVFAVLAATLVLAAHAIALAPIGIYRNGMESKGQREQVTKLLGERFPDLQVEFVKRTEDPRDYRVSFEKARASLGFEVETNVPGGIDEVASLLRSGSVPDPYAAAYRN